MFFFITSIYAQNKNDSDSLNLKIKLNFENETIEFDKKYCSKNKDTIYFNEIKFYISNIKIKYIDNSIDSEKNSYHLIDLANPETLSIKLSKKNKEINKLIFNIGVDSIASTSGALSEDLDVTNGMYWAWQSGYINFKIEGKSNSCKTRKNKFQFHIGGYLSPYYSMRTVEIPIKNLTNNYKIIFDLGNLFSKISLKETNSIMIPGKDAMKFSDILSNIVYIE